MISEKELEAWMFIDEELSELEHYRNVEDFGSSLENQHLMVFRLTFFCYAFMVVCLSVIQKGNNTSSNMLIIVYI